MDSNTPTHFKEIIMKDTPKVKMAGHTPPMQEIVELKFLQEEATISLLALSYISCPQTFNIWGCIKCYKVVVLVDNWRTNNFIHNRVVE